MEDAGTLREEAANDLLTFSRMPNAAEYSHSPHLPFTSNGPIPPAIDLDYIAKIIQAVMDNLPLPKTSVRASMPHPGTGNAPPTFDGKRPKALPEFFKQLEQCFTDAEVTTNADKLRYLTRYLSPTLREYVEQSVPYKNNNYVLARTNLYDSFGHPETKRLYRKDDLEAYVSKYSIQQLDNVEELYSRDLTFDLIAGALKDSGGLTKAMAAQEHL